MDVHIKYARHEGSYYQMAHHRGLELRKTFTPPNADERKRALTVECERLLRGVYPPLGEQFDGFVDGGAFDRDDFAAYYFARERSVHRQRCTMFAVAPEWTIEGHLLVGRNYDWVRGDLQWCELREIRPDGVAPMLGYSNHWIGCPDVLTAEGLLIALATLPSHPIHKPGLQWNAVIDITAATCATVPEARETIAGLPHIRAMNYLVADATTAAVLEATPGGVKRRDLRDRCLVATNRPVDPEDIAGDCPRFTGARQSLRRAGQKVDRDIAKVILRDHDIPLCDGDHASAAPDNWETIWSFVCDPSAMALEIAPGRPCEHQYVPLSFQDGALRWSSAVRS